jgi:hypothetical protein
MAPEANHCTQPGPDDEKADAGMHAEIDVSDLFHAPNRPPIPLRERHRGELRWTLGKGASRLSCELVDNGANGAQYRLLVNGAFCISRRFGRLDLAIVGADDIRCQLEHDGWIGIYGGLSHTHPGRQRA